MPSLTNQPVPSLDDLSDVDASTVAPSDGDALVYDAVSGLWVPGAVSGEGGGIAEAFVADSVSTSTTAVAATGGVGNLQFRVSSTTLGRFRTAGVPSMSSAVTSVSLPAGLWSLFAQVRLTASTPPTSGYYDLMFSLENEYHRVPWRQLTDASNTATGWVHRMYLFASPTAIGVRVFNETNQSVTASCRVFGGARLAEYGALTLA